MFHVTSTISVKSTPNRDKDIRLNEMLKVRVGLVFHSKNVQFHIICSFYINTTEFDPPLRFTAQWYSETQKYSTL